MYSLQCSWQHTDCGVVLLTVLLLCLTVGVQRGGAGQGQGHEIDGADQGHGTEGVDQGK